MSRIVSNGLTDKDQGITELHKMENPLQARSVIRPTGIIAKKRTESGMKISNTFNPSSNKPRKGQEVNRQRVDGAHKSF